ncbi:MAG: hypothetical protein O3B75_05815 [Planctomycetota bacterium]|nr:hypothetical protein [Planctomycetota bacterium]
MKFCKLFTATSFVTCIALSLVANAVDDAASQSVPPVVAPAPIIAGHLYDRIAVIGASASDGFGVSVRKDSPPADSTAKKSPPIGLNLSDVLRYAAKTTMTDGTTSQRVIMHKYSSGFFFTNPGPIGRGEINRALKIKPTLVLGLDFLFWYVYGTVTAEGNPMTTGADRLSNLELGLDQLDRIVNAGVPLVIADIANMRDAIGKMLSENQVPDIQTIESANKRIIEWVKARPLVKIMPLSQILATLKSGGAIELAGKSWNPAELGQLIQADQLHPTFAGTVVLAAGLIDLAKTNDPSTPPPFDFDPKLIRERVLEKLAAKKPKEEPKPTEDSPATH